MAAQSRASANLARAYSACATCLAKNRHGPYKFRKAIVEPVFGQIKQARGLRGFCVRGMDKAKAEWRVICLTHNLLKLFRRSWLPQPA
ncbi:MAG TPA: transposase [Bryobacteraceae bacterium]|nr:transposase [Bryobacteraceae bacterium]